MRLGLTVIISLFILTGCINSVTPQERALAESSPAAAFSLGNKLYAEGREKQGMEWIQRAADQGYPKANYAIGLLFASGQYTQGSLVEAEHYLLQASESGLHQASFKLAEYYRLGTLGEKDSEKAVSFYERAIDQGSMDARKALGVMYLQGIGIDKNPRKAKDLLSVFN